MNYIDLETAIEIHNDIIEEIGGLGGYNETQIGYLASVLEQIKNDEYYPAITDKIAHLMFSCIKFHPFLDGNKRTSIFLGMHFLDLDNKYNEKFAETMEDVVVGVADGSVSKEELNKILKKFVKINRNQNML
ncbi:type II toxin-antitoxin system death-on-curing family toxin [Helicobacter burdigaliensis]|uniref:type II toxin-antitoxin system death-on-curing family toxin n=1 Tax=Helicobacter burdigaliensis TaxID=2315334 RepID=UPI000EF671CA|nr:Fic family protein [Helicobacter burdigaliensis]